MNFQNVINGWFETFPAAPTMPQPVYYGVSINPRELENTRLSDEDVDALKMAHNYQANYMQDALTSTDELSPADLSPELTKHFRGLRMWLPLKLHGIKPFRAALEEKLLLARYFYKEIQKIQGFVVGPEPELSVVTYRYLPKNGDADAFNKKLVDAVQHDGRVFISSTILDRHFTLRLAVLSFRTHLRTIDRLLEVLKETVALLDNEILK